MLFQLFEKKVNGLNISIRTGCFSNPSVDERVNGIGQHELEAYFNNNTYGDYYDAMKFLDKLRGSVRISIGFVTNAGDIERFISFADPFLTSD